MTLEQIGAYALLLDHQWCDGGRLPLDHSVLARKLGVGTRKFATLWAVVGNKFDQDEDGYFNRKLDETMSRAREISDKRREAGRLGGRAQPGSNDPANGQAIAQANASDLLKQNGSTRVSRDRASYISNSCISESEVDGVAIPDALNAPAFLGKWEEWLAYRRKRRWSTKPDWQQKQLDKLAGFGVDVAVRTLDYSMDQGYQGIFPEKLVESPPAAKKVHAISEGYARPPIAKEDW